MFRMKYIKKLILFLFLASFVISGLFTAYIRRDLFHTDQSIFVDLAYGFSESSFYSKLCPPVHIALGAKSETHPLAPYCFSFLVEDFKSLYPYGKLLNLLWGLLVLLLQYKVISKHCGEIAGLVGTFALASNFFFRYNCIQLTSEPLLLLFFLIWIDYSVRCIESDGKGFFNWSVAGAAAGLAYMAKPQAIILPLVFVITFCVLRKRPPAKQFCSFYLCFFLACSPLMVARSMQGRFPLYNANFNTVFALTVDEYDDAHDIPHIEERGLYSNLSKALRLSHLTKYIFHIPVFFKIFVNRIFNRYLPGPIPGVFWLIAFAILFKLFATDEKSSRALAPLLLTFFVIYAAALLPVTINNDSARFYFPLQICLHFAIGRLVEKSFAKQATLVLLICGLLFFSIVIFPSLLQGTYGNPLVAYDASIESFAKWLSEQEREITVHYTYYEKWWLERRFELDHLKQKGIEFIEVKKEQVENGLNDEPNALLVLSPRSFDFELKSARTKKLRSVDFLPHRFTINGREYVQVSPMSLSKISVYQLLNKTKARPPLVPTNK